MGKDFAHIVKFNPSCMDNLKSLFVYKLIMRNMLLDAPISGLEDCDWVIQVVPIGRNYFSSLDDSTYMNASLILRVNRLASVS